MTLTAMYIFVILFSHYFLQVPSSKEVEVEAGQEEEDQDDKSKIWNEC